LSDRPKTKISRRDFARKTAIAASAACLPTLAPRTADAAAQNQTNPALSAPSQTEVDTSVATILRKYGVRMTDEQKLDVRRIVTENQKSLEAMRNFAIDNADQPGNVLKVYPDATADPTLAPSTPRHETPRNKQ
jgi:hypothetical protein